MIAAGVMSPQPAVVSDQVRNGVEHVGRLLRLFRSALCLRRNERPAARERTSALTDRRYSGLPRLMGARGFDLCAEMFPAEIVPTKAEQRRRPTRRTARLKDTATEDGACLRRVNGGSDVSGFPTRSYIVF